ncbi:hypothetical protein ABZ135_02905 [Streptomyces sp. NPDC006339]|uniref:hypothetical protein n=1 Tax=Streptomyces sp. NPDC006339 TaxID=3156755 RepID=UPI0033B14D0E
MSAPAVSRWQRLSWWATLPVSLGVAYGASALTARARAFCDAAWEPPHRLVHLGELVLLAGGTVTAALLAAVAARRVTAGASRPVRASAQLASVLVVLGLLAWWYVSARATPGGYPGDSGLCPASNVPPWWPGWLPS